MGWPDWMLKIARLEMEWADDWILLAISDALAQFTQDLLTLPQAQNVWRRFSMAGELVLSATESDA